MPSRAIRDKERRWKLARNAVWGCVPARLSSEVPATWVPATELVPGGERAPWSSRSWGMSVWGAGQEAWAQVGSTGVDGRLFGPVHVFRYHARNALFLLAQPARAGDVPATDYAAAGAGQLTLGSAGSASVKIGETTQSRGSNRNRRGLARTYAHSWPPEGPMRRL